MSKPTLTCLIAALIVSSAGAMALRSTTAQQLASASLADRADAKNKLLEERAQTIADLIVLANAPEPPEPQEGKLGTKRLAIELLGHLRAQEAVGVLFQNLRFKVPISGGTYGQVTSLGSNYPAAGSLAKIGRPAVDEAMKRVELSDDPLERELCTWIIGEAESGDVARYLIQHRIAKADRLTKPRLEAARALLDKTP